MILLMILRRQIKKSAQNGFIEIDGRVFPKRGSEQDRKSGQRVARPQERSIRSAQARVKTGKAYSRPANAASFRVRVSTDPTRGSKPSEEVILVFRYYYPIATVKPANTGGGMNVSEEA